MRNNDDGDDDDYDDDHHHNHSDHHHHHHYYVNDDDFDYNNEDHNVDDNKPLPYFGGLMSPTLKSILSILSQQQSGLAIGCLRLDLHGN